MFDEVRETLLADRAEARADGESGVTDAAIEACEKFAFHIGLDSGMPWPEIATAAFGQDDGQADLVLRCARTGRRVSFLFSADGSRCRCYRIDARLFTHACLIDVDDFSKVTSTCRWVAGS